MKFYYNLQEAGKFLNQNLSVQQWKTWFALSGAPYYKITKLYLLDINLLEKIASEIKSGKDMNSLRFSDEIKERYPEPMIENLRLANGLMMYYRVPSSDYGVFFEDEYYRHIHPNTSDIVMDIGANMGDMPLKWGTIVKEMYCYEPVKSTFNVLSMNINENSLKNCFAYEKSVGSEDGEMEIWEGRSNHSAAVASSVHMSGRIRSVVEKISFATEITRIKPTILKMDIEAGEYEILSDVDPKLFDSCNLFVIEMHPQLIDKITGGGGEAWCTETVDKFTKIFGYSKPLGISKYFNVVRGRTWLFSRNPL